MSVDSGTDSPNIRPVTSAPSASRTPAIIKVKKIARPWLHCLEDNKVKWHERATEESMTKTEQKTRGIAGDTTPESEL